VVPGGMDATASPLLAPGVNEAASIVMTVDKDEANLHAMEEVGKLNDTQSIPELISGLKKAIASPQKMVREFALQAAVIQLGRVAPNDAVGIIQAYAANDPDATSIADTEELVSYIRLRIGTLMPWKPMYNVMMRCLVVFAQSPSRTVAEQAIETLTSGVAEVSINPNFQARNVLNAAEITALKKVLDSPPSAEAANASMSVGNRDVNDISYLRQWLAQ
jgi:hypothetical protein